MVTMINDYNIIGLFVVSEHVHFVWTSARSVDQVMSQIITPLPH